MVSWRIYKTTMMEIEKTVRCEPTVRGEMKKARAGNYDTQVCLFEFIDNALDAGADRIRIDIRERSGRMGIPHKILVSDNVAGGIPSERRVAMFSWTYERPRQAEDIGEYGTGFKSAAVNLAEKLTVITSDGEQCHQMMADWQDMADENRWTPQVLQIQSDYYQDVHPFRQGSTFVLEGLRYEMFSVASVEKKWMIRHMFEEMAYHYRHLLHSRPSLTIAVRGTWESGGDLEERDLRSHDLFQSTIEPTGVYGTPPSRTTRIRIYQDALQFYRVFFQTDPKKWEHVEFIDRRKNGNSVLRCHDVMPSTMEGMRLVDSLELKSYHFLGDVGRSAMCMSLYPTCSIDLVRCHRVVGKELVIRAPRADPLTFFVKHELWYNSHAINPLLGVQFNKQNHGVFYDNDLRHTVEYLQQSHEREFLRCERLARPSPLLSSATTTTTPLVGVVPSIPSPTAEIVTGTTTPASAVRRRNFSPQTKIETLRRQECRDSILDLVLRDNILLMEYDHKNGVPTINTKENCQVLSVLTHSIKTRCPAVFETLCENRHNEKISYLVDLLNCITRSRFFLEAFAAGNILIRQPNQLSAVHDGLFDLVPEKLK